MPNRKLNARQRESIEATAVANHQTLRGVSMMRQLRVDAPELLERIEANARAINEALEGLK